MHLFDVNILLAVFFKTHLHHEKAANAYKKYAPRGWATCPTTENGFTRVGLQKVFIDESRNSDRLRDMLTVWKSDENYQFWADELSILDDLILNIPNHTSVTELQLLALAVKNGGKFVTFNQRIQADCVRGGPEALIIIE